MVQKTHPILKGCCHLEAPHTSVSLLLFSSDSSMENKKKISLICVLLVKVSSLMVHNPYYEKKKKAKKQQDLKEHYFVRLLLDVLCQSEEGSFTIFTCGKKKKSPYRSADPNQQTKTHSIIVTITENVAVKAASYICS